MTQIKLSDHFTYGRLLRYTAPSVGMMLFLTIYYIVDGFFIANFVGTVSFAAINFIVPVIVVPSAVAFMLSAGGAAVVATTLGEQKPEMANRYFSLFIYTVAFFGIIMTILGEWYLPYFLRTMGATGDLADACIVYGAISLLGLPAFMMQVMFQALWSVAERPRYGLYSAIASGFTNLVLDYIFIVPLDGGIAGAAWASIISQYVGGVGPIVYFGQRNGSLLRLIRPSWDWGVLRRGAYNGLSEMVTSMSASVLGIVYNWQLLRFMGADGVAAYGVILYANGIFESLYFGYGMGASALISYHFGANNNVELRNILRKSIVIVFSGSILVAALCWWGAKPLTGLFVSRDPVLWQLTVYAFSVYALSFVIGGFNGFGSAFFTALNNGTVSSIISVSRVLIFQVGAVWFLPILVGIHGIWWSIIVAEIGAFIVILSYLWALRHKYGY